MVVRQSGGSDSGRKQLPSRGRTGAKNAVFKKTSKAIRPRMKPAVGKTRPAYRSIYHGGKW